MSKAEQVFNKLALSARTIEEAADSAKKLMNKLTGSRYKPKSFAENRKIRNLWSRKFDQRAFLESVANKNYLRAETEGKTNNFIRMRMP